jgi:hypothetical protein
VAVTRRTFAISRFGAAPLARFKVITNDVKAETARASRAA